MASEPTGDYIVSMVLEPIREIARRIHEAGGRALLVGGYVRDRLRGCEAKDIDVEVYGLQESQLHDVLAQFGDVISIGRAFGVLRVKGLDVDFALPRRDTKVGVGHRGFEVEVDPYLSFEVASRRRDLTINSMGMDPLTGEVLDPHGGQQDLRRRVLRATDPLYFPDDPLRGLRVAQFAARFEMHPDPPLVELCSRLDLGELPGERIFEELRKLLVKGTLPSLGLDFIRRSRQLRFFPILHGLVGVPQDPEWHPEGDVWTHTVMVVDCAAKMRPDDSQDALVLMLAALCHDLGKQVTTEHREGRVRSYSHDVEGARMAAELLSSLRGSRELSIRVSALVENHLAPYHLVRGGATLRAYRRLSRKLATAGVTMQLLELLARADHFGRATPEAKARSFSEGDEFLRTVDELEKEERVTEDVVKGRHLIARGLTPGPVFSELLRRCRDVQDDTGWQDPDCILDVVLKASGPSSKD